jgi:HK97 family phage prohead protease
METKFIPLEVKASEDGIIEGYGSVFGNRDLGGDIVDAMAFDETIASGKRIKMLWQHDADNVLGVWDEISKDQTGLKVKGRIATRTKLGGDIAELARMGAVDGLSIGFMTKEEDWDGPTRIIKRADLWEVSLVTFPMNPEARISAVKAADMSEREIEWLLTRDAKLSRSVAHALMKGGMGAVKAMRDAGPTGFTELAQLMRSTLKKENTDV